MVERPPHRHCKRRSIHDSYLCTGVGNSPELLEWSLNDGLGKWEGQTMLGTLDVPKEVVWGRGSNI